MYAISAEETKRDSDARTYEVVVAKGDNEYVFTVLLPLGYFKTHAKGVCSEKEFVEKTFRFLIDHEPPWEILSTFSIAQVESYFPDFPKSVLQY